VTSDNLPTAVIGGLVGGLLGLLGGVILAVEQRLRWLRENRSAVRLLYHEVGLNLSALRQRPFTGHAFQTLSRTVWDSQQVRIASALPPAALDRLIQPYLRLTAMQRVWSDFSVADITQQLAADLNGPPEGSFTKELTDTFTAALGLLAPEGPSSEAIWLGVGPGGLLKRPARKASSKPTYDM